MMSNVVKFKSTKKKQRNELLKMIIGIIALIVAIGVSIVAIVLCCAGLNDAFRNPLPFITREAGCIILMLFLSAMVVILLDTKRNH